MDERQAAAGSALNAIISKLSTARAAMVLCAAFVVLHGPAFSLPPNGYHMWRETDTATVIENLAVESFDVFAPRVNVRGTGHGIVGMEFPAYNLIAATADRLFFFSHVWPRAVSLLAALASVFAVMALARRLLPGDRVAALAATLLASSSPLLFFYGVKIMPDAFALAWSLWGFERFLAWDEARQNGSPRRSRRFLASAAALAIAGAVKPMFLCVGLPMAAHLVTGTKDGWRALFRPAPLALAALVLAPTAAWFHHARALTAVYGNHYFYLGDSGASELAGLKRWDFYQNVFLTWPWEMALAMPSTILLFVTAVRPRLSASARNLWWQRRTGVMMMAWALGALIVCILTAEHCATPHDYYFLPWVPVLTIVAGRAASLALRDHARWMRRGAAILLPVAAVAGVLRVVPGRYDFRDSEANFLADRAAIARAIPADALVVAVDSMPGGTLYQAGRKGWQAGLNASLAKVNSYYAKGARFAILPREHSTELLHSGLPPAVVETRHLSVHPLLPPLQQAPSAAVTGEAP